MDKAKKQGIEEGRAEGIEEGRAEGIEEGLVRGRLEEARRIAKGLKEKGTEIAIISEITKLPKSEIESI